MKVGTNVFALALLILISTWGLSGCSKQGPATTTKTDTRNKETEKADEHAKHAEAKTTCHSCRDVEHLLAKLSKDYRGRAAVIALDANADETAERVAAFVKKNGLELPVVLDPRSNTADLFGVKRTTTTVVIDGKGVLRY